MSRSYVVYSIDTPAKKRKTADEQPVSAPLTQVYIVEGTYSTKLLDDYDNDGNDYIDEHWDKFCVYKYRHKFNTEGTKAVTSVYREIEAARKHAREVFKKLVAQLIGTVHSVDKGRYCAEEEEMELFSQFNMVEDEEEGKEQEFGEDVETFLSKVNWDSYLRQDGNGIDPNTHPTSQIFLSYVVGWTFEGPDMESVGQRFIPCCKATVCVQVIPVPLVG
jgi:hypothetical protein